MKEEQKREQDRKKEMRILEGMSGADEELVERSDEDILAARRKKLHTRYLAVAAVAAIMILGVLGIYGVTYKGSGADGAGNQAAEYTSMLQVANIAEDENRIQTVAEQDGKGAVDMLPEAATQEALNGAEAAYDMSEDRGIGEKPDAAIESEKQKVTEEGVVESEELPMTLDSMRETENWGLGFGESGTQPSGNATPAELKPYNAYYLGSPDEKVIYLTMDCGYENGYAPMILDTLKKHDIKITFFITGAYIESSPELVKRMHDEGHTIGNHSYSHPDMSKILDEESFLAEMHGVSDLYEELIGEKMSVYYRPPQGKFNVQNLEMAKRLGYYTIFWSLAHVDWDTAHQPDHDATIQKLDSRIHPGAVVLLHIISKTNAEILDQLLTDWENMGYRFGTLDELCGNE